MSKVTTDGHGNIISVESVGDVISKFHDAASNYLPLLREERSRERQEAARYATQAQKAIERAEAIERRIDVLNDMLKTERQSQPFTHYGAGSSPPSPTVLQPRTVAEVEAEQSDPSTPDKTQDNPLDEARAMASPPAGDATEVLGIPLEPEQEPQPEPEQPKPPVKAKRELSEKARATRDRINEDRRYPPPAISRQWFEWVKEIVAVHDAPFTTEDIRNFVRDTYHVNMNPKVANDYIRRIKGVQKIGFSLFKYQPPTAAQPEAPNAQ